MLYIILKIIYNIKFKNSFFKVIYIKYIKKKIYFTNINNKYNFTILNK